MKVNGIAGVIERAMETANAANRSVEGDYLQDGLMYCGKCHTPKQTMAPNPFGEPFLVGVPCECKTEERRRERAEKEKERIEDLRHRAFDTEGMFAKTFMNDDGKTPELTTVARNYAEIIAQPDKTQWMGMILYGEVDGGKSYAAASVVNELVDRGISCLMRTFISLANDIYRAQDKNEYIRSLDRYRLLVLDDLGAEKESPWMFEVIYQIVDYRTRSGLPMLITANLTWDEIKNPQDRRNERIYSRICETCYPQKVISVNRRSQAAADRFVNMRERLSKPLEPYKPYVREEEPEAELPKIPVSSEIQSPTKLVQQKKEPVYVPEMTDEQANRRRNEVLNALSAYKPIE